jgi:sugar/nucleoside kinase (ribokinase family)
MPKASFIKTIIAGNLTDEYIIDTRGKASNHICGGSLLYSAAGAKPFIDEIGLLSRVDASYPGQWLSTLETKGFDTRGILRAVRPFERRRFYAWRDTEHCDYDNPVTYYAKNGLPFPHELLGYHQENIPGDDTVWGNISISIRNGLPREFLDVTSAHLCPLDFSTQVKLINLLEGGTINTLTITPAPQYMKPEFVDELRVILKGAAAFFPTETQMTSLCHTRAREAWEMMELIAEMGCQLVVVTRGLRGYWMFDAKANKRYTLPLYPSSAIDPTGMNDVFAGAFHGDFKNSYDPVHALLSGCVYASLALEGTGPFYCSEALPGLAEARFEKMKTLLTIQ